MSEDNRDMYRPTYRPTAADSARRCDICNAWTDHHTDRCPSLDDEELADEGFVAFQLQDARNKIKGGK